MQHIVYILECSDKSLYVGCTNDSERRLWSIIIQKEEHITPRLRRPVTLLYSEQFQTLKQARGREVEIKTLTRKKKLDLIGKSPIKQYLTTVLLICKFNLRQSTQQRECAMRNCKVYNIYSICN